MFPLLLFDTYLSLFSNIWILIAILFVSLIFLHKKYYDFGFWERKGIKGPKPLPFVGNFLELFMSPVVLICTKHFEKYGRIYGFYERWKPVLSLAEPELLRYVMVKDSDIFVNRRLIPTSDPVIRNMLTSLRDDRWKRVRTIMSPTFTSGKIKKMTEIINACIKSLLEALESKVNNNDDIDVKALYGAFTMDVIASCAFATKTNSHSNPNDPLVVNAKKLLNFKIWRIFAITFMPKFMREITRFNAVPGGVIDFFRSTTKEIIKQRRNQNVKGNDFMQLLLDTQGSPELSPATSDINSEQLSNKNLGEMDNSTAKLLSTTIDGEAKLTDNEILGQCLFFFIAGYETTTSLLSFSTYALALNTECQEILYNEVKHYYDICNEITYENINKMKYLNAVINESLRLYTPVIRVEREARKHYTFPNTDISIPKGTLVQIPLYTIHHDEKNFADPCSFKPERFLPENESEIKPYTFMPFGSGPRNCLGMRFALMEAKLAMCNLILRYKFVKCDKTDIPLKMRTFTIFLLPVENVTLKFEKRINLH